MQIRCKSAVCQCHRHQSLTLMDFFFRSHLQLCVYFTRLNINSKSLFCQKTRRRPAELSSGPINFCLTDEFSKLEETGSNTFAEILSKIEERPFREGLEDCVKCQDTLQATDWQSQKGESKSESDLAPRSSTRRGRLSAFQSLLAHDKWCWMRSVKRREIRNTELPTENEQSVCKINLWPREIECRGFVAAPTSTVLKGDVACGRWGDRLKTHTTHLQSGCWIMRTVHDLHKIFQPETDAYTPWVHGFVVLRLDWQQ